MKPGALAGTLTPKEAERSPWDAIVIGAGPAGSIAAVMLARIGLRALLVDRAVFPRDKTCGCCLAASTVSALSKLDLAHVLDRCHAAPMDRFDLRTAGQTLEVPLPPGRVLSRRQLDVALIEEAIDAGVAFLPHCLARMMECDDTCRRVRLAAHGATANAAARIVLAAGGLGFSLDSGSREARSHGLRWGRSRLGAATMVSGREVDLPHGTVRMLVGSRGYVGLARIEDGRVAVAGALDPLRVRACGGPAAAAAEVFDECRQTPPVDLAAARWLGAPELTRRPSRVATPRVLAIGDAAGFVEPFTGEGMAWAAESARAAAALAANYLNRGAEQWSQSIEAEWSRLHAVLIRARQLRCRLIAEALRHAVVQSGCMRIGRAMPPLSRFLARRIHAPISGAAMTSPLARGPA